MILVINRFLIKGHFNFSQMLPSESPIFAEQDDIYIFFFFTAYGWPVRLEIQNPFFGPKSARVTKG